MDFQYKMVNIYADSSNNLIIVPTGRSENWGANMEIDCALQLNNPYDDQQLANILKEAMSKCFSLIPSETDKKSTLEKVLGINGYSKATKGRRLVVFNWNHHEGYSMTPTKKSRGYDHLEEKAILLGQNPTDEELVKSFEKALRLSID